MPRHIGLAIALCLAGALGADPLREAAEALEREDFAAAIPHLRAGLEEDPSNVNARFNLAYALQAAGDGDGAIAEYRRIAEDQPGLVPARQNLATLLMQAGRFAEAAREYEALDLLRPPGLADLLLLATAHGESGNGEAAVDAYRRALAVDSESLEALAGLAGRLVALGRLHEAVPHYLAAAGRDPRYEGALLDIAQQLERAGAAQDALQLYRRYARSRPGDAAVQEEIGLLLLEDGNARAAAEALERAVAAKPASALHAALAEAYRRLGRDDSFQEHLRLAAEAPDADAAARVRHASALLQAQRYEQAARQYLAACEADPRSRDAWNGLAFAMFQIGNYPATLRALQEAASLGQPQAASAYLKALALDKVQQYEAARDAYRAFLALDSAMEDERWKASQRLRTIERVLARR